MADAPSRPVKLGRQALVLFVALVAGFVVGAATASPFDIDAGAGHAILHIVFAASVATAGVWLLRHGTQALASRFARWSAIALAVAQIAEGLAAVAEPSGNSTAHEVPNRISLMVLQPLVLVALLVLVLQALRERQRVGPRR